MYVLHVNIIRNIVRIKHVSYEEKKRLPNNKFKIIFRQTESFRSQRCFINRMVVTISLRIPFYF